MISKLMYFHSKTLPIHQTNFQNSLFTLPYTISTATTTVSCLPTTATATATYGPSLQKGISVTSPSPNPFHDSQNDQELPLFDEEQFTRVYQLTAIRVPVEDCYEIENRIRGHLLNWPRVRNIARVCGDDVDCGVPRVYGVGNTVESIEKTVNRRIYGRGDGDGEELSEVLYRDKLVKEFNASGFVKFRNLAKISRPIHRKKRDNKKESGVRDGKGSRRKSGVEVVVVGDNVGELSGLLGDGFEEKTWRGSSRLLLLDEKYAGREIDELPEAVKAVLNDGSSGDSKSSLELVRCSLTLFYEYWPCDEILSALLPKDMIILSAFESVGHVAHLNLKDEHLPYKKAIAKVVLDKNKPKIQTVVNKIEAISNDYRTMQLEVLAGNRSLVTTVIENGLRFQLDLGTVYWNSRLATERQRLINSFTNDDVLCDVFSGVGPIAVSAAKKVKRVYANDLNPNAVDYLERNCVINKLERKIKVFHMDGRRFIEAVFSDSNAHPITQVVMNLPNNAVEFLDAFRGIFRNRPTEKKLTLPKIHVYGFSKAEDPEFDFHERIRIALAEAAFSVEMRRVRQVAPGKWMLCASFVLPQKVALGKDDIDSKLEYSSK